MYDLEGDQLYRLDICVCFHKVDRPTSRKIIMQAQFSSKATQVLESKASLRVCLSFPLSEKIISAHRNNFI